MSLPREHGPFKWMSNFKAFAVDYEYYLSLSDEPQSICLTERQMYVLSVQNSYTYWLTRWYNTDDITQKTVQFIAAEIEQALMCGCGIPMPTSTDYFSTINYVNNTTAIYNDTFNTWNEGGQTVISIAPNLDFDTGDPVNISKLVCAAVELLVKSIMAQAKQMKTQTQAQNENMTSQIGTAMAGLATAGGIASQIGGIGASAVSLFGGPWMLLGLALGAVGLAIYNAVAQADTALFDDKTAIDHVICSIQKNLDNAQVTRDAFAGSLVPLGYGSGTPEAQIAAILQPFFSDLNTYLQFMTFGNQLYGQVSSFAAMPDCGCEDAECEDLKTGEHGWEKLDPVYATYYPGSGFGRGTNPSRIGIMKNVSGTITNITIKFNQNINGYAIGVFPGYNSFGSEIFGSITLGDHAILSGAWSAGFAFEIFEVGFPSLPVDLRVTEICMVITP